MESYDEFFSRAKLYTQIHARPNEQQLELIAPKKAQDPVQNKTISLNGVLGNSSIANAFGTQPPMMGFQKDFGSSFNDA